MRKLSGKLRVNKDTFVPEIVLLLDGKETDQVFDIEASQDIGVSHGKEAVQKLIAQTVDLLQEYYDLTNEEVEYYTANFSDLIKVDYNVGV